MKKDLVITTVMVMIKVVLLRFSRMLLDRSYFAGRTHRVHSRIAKGLGENLERVTKHRIWCLLSNIIMQCCEYEEFSPFLNAFPWCRFPEI